MFKAVLTKKPVLIGLVVFVALLALGGGIWAWKSKSSTPPVTESPKKKKVSEPVNVLVVAERPYILIQPTDAYHVTINIQDLKKPATEVEYELEYQAGSLLQGAFDKISLATVPATKEIFFGSCSAGGACTKHEDVKGGTLLTRFSGPENYALKSDWRFFDTKNKDTQVASKDAKFQLESPELKTTRFAVVFNSPGYPDGLTGTPVSDPYVLTSATPLKGKASLTMRANEEGTLKVMGWDGTAWKSFEAVVEGKSVTAQVELMQAYILVK